MNTKKALVILAAHVAVGVVVTSTLVACNPTQQEIDDAVKQQACLILGGANIEAQLQTKLESDTQCVKNGGYVINQHATLCHAPNGQADLGCVTCDETSGTTCDGSATVSAPISATLLVKGVAAVATGSAAYTGTYSYAYHNAQLHSKGGASAGEASYYQSVGFGTITGQGLNSGSFTVSAAGDTFSASITGGVNCGYKASAQIAHVEATGCVGPTSGGSSTQGDGGVGTGQTDGPPPDGGLQIIELDGGVKLTPLPGRFGWRGQG